MSSYYQMKVPRPCGRNDIMFCGFRKRVCITHLEGNGVITMENLLFAGRAKIKNKKNLLFLLCFDLTTLSRGCKLLLNGGRNGNVPVLF